MKKALKIVGISLLSILAVAVVAIVVVCNIVFSPKALTPIVRDNIGKILTCQADLDTVDLTFFTSFPRFSLHATNVRVINPQEGVPTDTVASIGDLSASVNLTAFLFRNEIILDHFSLENAEVNIFVDEEGKANYDIIVPSNNEKEEKDAESSFVLSRLQIDGVTISNVSAQYIDRQMGVDARLQNVNGEVNGLLQGANGNVYAALKIGGVEGHYCDSTVIDANIENLLAKITGTLEDNHFKGKAEVRLPETTVVLNGDTMTNRLNVEVKMPAEYNFDLAMAHLHKGVITIDDNEIIVDGPIQLQDQSGNINMDISLLTSQMDIERVMALVPKTYTKALDGIDIKGNAQLTAQAKGVFSSDTTAPQMPKITAALNIANGKVAYPAAIPYVLEKVGITANANIDLNNGGISNATISALSAQTGTMRVNATGEVTDLLGDIGCNVKLNADLNLPELMPLMPDSLKLDVKGRAKADIAAKFKLNDITNLSLERIAANATIGYTDLYAQYNDSITITDSRGTITLHLPLDAKERKNAKELMKATIDATNLKATMIGLLAADLQSPTIAVIASNPLDTTKLPTARCEIKMAHLSGTMDTITVDIAKPTITATLSPTKSDPKAPVINATYSSDNLRASMGEMAKIATGALSLKAASRFNNKEENMLLRYNPRIDVDFNNGVIDYAQVPTFEIPSIKFEFRPNDINIEKSRIVVQNSDFNLSGDITNLRKYIENKGLLTGELLFESSNTNINELMAIANGFGNEKSDSVRAAEDAEVKAAAEKMSATEEREPNPFMVPKGVDLRLVTMIHQAQFDETQLKNVKGNLTIKDGIAIVEQMGFTTEAAEMQLTGMYRSDRKNHLFAGVDFHLLNIDIHKLIDLIPAIDTVVPMLKSFEGAAEFHIAAETYLNAWYRPKISTLRAAAAIEGKDLVLLDNETFSTIAKYMMFNKKTRNVVDSLSVEMTIFRDEIDLYPFLVSMDKWQAVLSGRHNLDMSFNYHISLTDCPLPVRLGLDVKGTLDKLKFDLVPCKYKALYKPEKQGATERQTLALKKLISDSLKANVKREEEKEEEKEYRNS